MIEHFFVADYFLFFCHIYIYIFVEHFWKIDSRSENKSRTRRAKISDKDYLLNYEQFKFVR